MVSMMNLMIPNERGIWIECCNPDCRKWRYSLDFDDPLVVPKKWFCYMSSDKSSNTCSAPEVLELPEDEIFIESKYKAGCIVWAKVIGHTWSPAMVDFCPEFETYYWFDKPKSNVPTEYHVTFFGGRQVTRAWVKSGNTKPFLGNENPEFALKSRVRRKRVTATMRKEILQGCEFAQAALRLPLSRRLKKYNFNSWRLAQRCSEPRSQPCDKKTSAPVANASNAKSSKNNPGQSDLGISVTDKTAQGKKLAKTEQSQKSLVKSHAPPKAAKRTGAVKIDQKILEESSKQQGPVFTTPADIVHQDNLHNDTLASEESSLGLRNTESDNDLDETRSIHSVFSKDLSETMLTKDKSRIAEKHIQMKMANQSVNLFADRNLLDEEITDIVIAALEEIIPSSQDTTPTKRYSVANSTNYKAKPPREDSGIERRSESSEQSTQHPGDTCSIGSKTSRDISNNLSTEKISTGVPKQIVELVVEGRRMTDILADKRLSNIEIEGVVKDALLNVVPNSRSSTPINLSLNQSGRRCRKAGLIDRYEEKENSEVMKVTESFETVLRSPQISGRGKVSLRKNSKNPIVEKSASENLMNTVNGSEESRYLKALSEFTLTEQQNQLSKNHQARRSVARKPLPPWFSNQEIRRKTEGNRLDRLLSTLTDQEDNNMYEESRKNFIAEMEGAGSSEEKSLSDLKPPNYFSEMQNYTHLITSDEESS